MFLCFVRMLPAFPNMIPPKGNWAAKILFKNRFKWTLDEAASAGGCITMKLPNSDSAYIASRKLKEYLLSESYPIGRSKAKFSRSPGFDEKNFNLLERGLTTIVRSQEIKEIESSPHGTKYIIEGFIGTPSGNQVQIRTVWIIETGEARPRFVTAYPL